MKGTMRSDGRPPQGGRMLPGAFVERPVGLHGFTTGGCRTGPGIREERGGAGSGAEGLFALNELLGVAGFQAALGGLELIELGVNLGPGHLVDFLVPGLFFRCGPGSRGFRVCHGRLSFVSYLLLFFFPPILAEIRGVGNRFLDSQNGR